MNKVLLPWKEVQEENYAEEEHGQAAANLSYDVEVVQVRTRDGFTGGVWLQKAK